MRTSVDEKNIKLFSLQCRDFLDRFSISELRAYGRSVGVSRATAKKKEDLIDDIIRIFIGELAPIERSRLGAPIKNDYVNIRIVETVNAYRYAYLTDVQDAPLVLDEQGAPEPIDWETMLRESKRKEHSALEVGDSLAEEMENGDRRVYVGQLQTLNGVSLLLPLDCTDAEDKIIISIEFIKEYRLAEGDVITCYAKRGNNFHVATTILTINGVIAERFRRVNVETADVCYPTQRLRLYDKENFNATEYKFTDWLIPFGKGQRGLIVSAPKSGKSQLLLRLARAAQTLNENLETYVLLVDQSPEIIGAYRKIFSGEQLLYTTYEEDPERQVFVAEYLLKRAKCQMESGKDVLLIVDSFNALARAFNETEASMGGKLLSGGLESKTIHFLKKYFGCARCLEKGGSLTILASISISTGNPADDLILSELSPISNLEVRLNDEMARRRIFPALDLNLVQAREEEELFSAQEKKFDKLLRKEYLTRHTPEVLLDVLEESESFEYFRARIVSEQ